MSGELLRRPSRYIRDKLKSGVLVYLILVGLLVASEIISPGFLSFKHIENVLRQSAFLGIVSIGQTLVVLTGGIDLSVASTVTLANIVGAQLMDGKDQNMLLATVVVVLIGILIGIANGSGVYYLKIPPLVMTLGVGSVLQGVALLYSKGAPKGYRAPFLQLISTGKIGGVFNGVISLWVIFAIITVLILRRTILGKSAYSIGSNIVAARYSGVKIPLVTISIYAISGVMSAITGMLLLGYTGTSYLNTGDPYTMNSIAAVVIGGTSVLGGSGGYVGTIAGSIIMTVIVSILTIINMPVSGRQIVQGSIIILLLLFVYSRDKSKL